MPRWTEEHWDVIIESQYKVVDPNSLEEYKPTNVDRIRAMSIQEMSTDLVNIFEELFEDGVPSPEWMKMWLQSEAE